MPSTNRDPQLVLSDAEISQLDDFSLCDKLWGLVVNAYHHHKPTDWKTALCNYPESLFAKDLSFHWWVAYALHAFEYDVLSGGLEEFFINHAGLTNAETLAALTYVGAHEYTQVFADACAVFDDFKDLFSNTPMDRDMYKEGRELFKEEIGPVESRLWPLLLHSGQDPRSYRHIYPNQPCALPTTLKRLTKRMQATARMASVVSSTLPARRRLIRDVRPHRMPDHLLTFELAKDGDELFIHADAVGLRYLASELSRLARDAEAGRKDHTHLMSDEWAGSELSADLQDSECRLLNQVTIHAWPTKGGVKDVVA